MLFRSTIWGLLKYSNLITTEKKESSVIKSPKCIKSVPYKSQRTLPTIDSALVSAQHKADSLEKLLTLKTAECDSLKQSEINLRQAAVNNEESGESSRALIRKVTELSEKIMKLERENAQLTISLNRLDALRKKRVSVPLNDDNPTPTTPPSNSPHRAILQVKIASLQTIYFAGTYEKETEDAIQAEMLKGIFSCENKSNEAVSGEIIMVLTDPAGNEVVLSQESGYFDSEKGRMAYT